MFMRHATHRAPQAPASDASRLDYLFCESSPLAHSRILVVDDEPSVAAATARMLRRAGAAVRVASSTRVPMCALGSLDVVISDQNMPGCCGLELAREVAKWSPPPAFILTTGYVSPALVSEARAAGARAVLGKPCSITDLKLAVETALREAQVSEAADNLWPGAPGAAELLGECLRTRSLLLSSVSETDPVGRLVLHKVSDDDRVLKGACEGRRSGVDSLERYRDGLKKLLEFVDGFRAGSVLGVPGYLDGLRHDLLETHPDLSLELDLPEHFEVSPKTSLMLVMGAMELVDNARRATPKGGRIKVIVRRFRTKPWVSLRVWNNGMLPVHLRDRLFEPGTSTNGPGRGQGLALLKRLLENCGGSLNVRVDEGVEFVAELPAFHREHLEDVTCMHSPAR